MSPERLIEKACVEQRDRINAILAKHIASDEHDRTLEVLPPIDHRHGWVARVVDWCDGEDDERLIAEVTGCSVTDALAALAQVLELSEN